MPLLIPSWGRRTTRRGSDKENCSSVIFFTLRKLHGRKGTNLGMMMVAVDVRSSMLRDLPEKAIQWWSKPESESLPLTAMFPTLPTLSTLPAALSQPFKRATLGLFHGKTIQYGNNVPHSLNKTRRTWLPNVHTKTFDSPLLARRVQVKVTARALRTIHKVRSDLALWTGGESTDGTPPLHQHSTAD